NTTNGTITVGLIQLGSGSNFMLSGTSMTLPATLSAGGSMQAYITFTASAARGGGKGEKILQTTPMVFTDQMFVATSQSIQPQVFQIQEEQAIASGVTATSAAVIDFTISPNPSSGRVTIGVANARTAAVEIFDILGS